MIYVRLRLLLNVIFLSFFIKKFWLWSFRDSLEQNPLAVVSDSHTDSVVNVWKSNFINSINSFVAKHIVKNKDFVIKKRKFSGKVKLAHPQTLKISNVFPYPKPKLPIQNCNNPLGGSERSYISKYIEIQWPRWSTYPHLKGMCKRSTRL